VDSVWSFLGVILTILLGFLGILKYVKVIADRQRDVTKSIAKLHKITAKALADGDLDNHEILTIYEHIDDFHDDSANLIKAYSEATEKLVKLIAVKGK
jgi:hypothetical protein